jgi:chromosome segregation ATPase
MKRLITSFSLLILIGAWTAQAQRLYDGSRDSIAQEAAAEAAAFTTGQLFETQQRNLEVLTAADIQAYLAQARQKVRAKVNSFYTWSDLHDLFQEVENSLAAPAGEDFDALKKQLEEQKAAAQAQLDALKTQTASDSGELDAVLERVGDVQSAVELALGQADVDKQTADKFFGILGEFTTLYQSYAEKMKQVEAIQGELADLKGAMKRIALDRLRVEEAYLTAQMAIEARRVQETAPLKEVLADGKAQLAKLVKGSTAQSDRIQDTLTRLSWSPDELDPAVQTLFAGAALAARRDVATDLAELRLAHAFRLRSIQLSAVNARGYETIIGAGVQHLALFYRGGIKPELIAQIIHAAATIAIPPVIAAN